VKRENSHVSACLRERRERDERKTRERRERDERKTRERRERDERELLQRPEYYFSTSEAVQQ
jgi:hypothetical protein